MVPRFELYFLHIFYDFLPTRFQLPLWVSRWTLFILIAISYSTFREQKTHSRACCQPSTPPASPPCSKPIAALSILRPRNKHSARPSNDAHS